MTHAVKQQAALPVHIVHTRNEAGVICFFVIRTSQTRAAQLKSKLGGGDVNIADYGEILASGYGQQPHRALAEELFNKYGVTFAA